MTFLAKFKKLPRLYFVEKSGAQTPTDPQLIRGAQTPTAGAQPNVQILIQQAKMEQAKPQTDSLGELGAEANDTIDALGLRTQDAASQLLLELELSQIEGPTTELDQTETNSNASQMDSRYNQLEIEFTENAVDSAPNLENVRAETRAEAGKVVKEGWFKQIAQKAWAHLRGEGDQRTKSQQVIDGLKLAVKIAGGATALVYLAPVLAAATVGTAAAGAALGGTGLGTYGALGLATMSSGGAFISAASMSGAAAGTTALANHALKKLSNKLGRKDEAQGSARPEPATATPNSPQVQSNLENRENQPQSININDYPAGTVIKVEVRSDEGITQNLNLTIQETSNRKYVRITDLNGTDEVSGYLYCQTDAEYKSDLLQPNQDHVIFNPEPRPEGIRRALKIGNFEIQTATSGPDRVESTEIQPPVEAELEINVETLEFDSLLNSGFDDVADDNTQIYPEAQEIANGVEQDVDARESSPEIPLPVENSNDFERTGYTSLFQIKNTIGDTAKKYNQDLKQNPTLKNHVQGNVDKINAKLSEDQAISLEQYQANQAAYDIFDSLPSSLKLLALKSNNDSVNLPDDTGIDRGSLERFNKGQNLTRVLMDLENISTSALENSKGEILSHNRSVDNRTNQQIFAQNYAKEAVNMPAGSVRDYLFTEIAAVLKTWKSEINLEIIKDGGTHDLDQLDDKTKEQFGKMVQQLLVGGTIDTVNPNTKEITYFQNQL